MQHQPADGDRIRYGPGTKIDFGIGASWNGLGGSISYSVGLENTESQTVDWQYHHYHRHFFFDVYGQSYHGFYQNMKDENTDDVFFPEMKVVRLGGSLQYGFNGNKFSFRAALGHNEKQLKSAGSFLLGANFNYTRVTMPESFASEEFTLRHNYFAGPIAGYAYTWVIKKDYYISLLASAGINVGLDNLKNEFDVYPVYFPRISAGYNAETWSVAMTGIFTNVNISYTENGRLNLDAGSAQITFIKRFHFQPPFCKKKK